MIWKLRCERIIATPTEISTTDGSKPSIADSHGTRKHPGPCLHLFVHTPEEGPILQDVSDARLTEEDSRKNQYKGNLFNAHGLNVY